MSPQNADAVERGRRLGIEPPAQAPEAPETAPAIVVHHESDWSHIPAQQILVVEYEGRMIAAVAVDTDEGRALYTQETTPCPTCGQDWQQTDRLGDDVKVLWPLHYKSRGPSR